MSKTVLVLGGYGGAGSAISRLLLEKTDVDLVIAGRSEEKARYFSALLKVEFGRRVSWSFADATLPQSLESAFEGVDMVVVAATTASHVQDVARAALEAGTDYLDIHYPQETVPVLKSFASEIEENGRTFVTQAGFHPGLPAVFIRKAASYFDSYERAMVATAMNTQFDPGGAVYEFVDSLSDYRTEAFEDGRWQRKGPRKVDFGPPFGIRTCYPTALEEIRPLPEVLGLKSVGVYVAGLNWFVDYVATPLAFVLGKVRKGLGRDLLARLMVWGSNTFSPSEEYVTFVLEAEGQKDGRRQTARVVGRHHDVYQFTAIPVIAFMLQYLEGKIAKPGLWMMGHIVDPARFVQDMKLMGVDVEVEVLG